MLKNMVKEEKLRVICVVLLFVQTVWFSHHKTMDCYSTYSGDKKELLSIETVTI